MARSRTTIPGYLARVRALVYRHEAVRASLHGFAALAALALVAPLTAWLLVGSRATALAILGTVGLLASLVLIGGGVLGFVVPRKRWGSDRELARWIGSRHAPIASDLLSAVELASAPRRPGAPSPELVGALVDATACDLEMLEPEALIPPREVPRARGLAIAAAAANVALALAAPRVVAAGWRALIATPPAPFGGAELSSIPLVGDLIAHLEFPAYSRRRAVDLPASSGDLRGLPGTAVTLQARVLVPATAAELVIEPDGSGPGASPTRVAATLDGDTLRAQLTITGSARYRIAITSPSSEHKIEASPRTIEAEPDQAPAVQLLAPADTLDVANLRRVELAYVIEDDFGIASAELVWDGGKDRGRKAITLGAADGSSPERAQGKLMWDIADIQVPSGGEVRYWLEAKDNDSIGGANLGKSRELRLRVVSPRERHEETLGRHQQVAEKLVRTLGARVVGLGDQLAAREDASKNLHDAVRELSAINGAYDKDPHASELMRKALAQMHERLDRLAASEQKLLPTRPGAKLPAGRFAALDLRIVTELEDDVIVLADWLERERMEGLLDVSDEIAAHHKRLADLLARYQQTRDPRLLEEVEREIRALDRANAELDNHQRGMAEDVLDQYVHREALASYQQSTSCVSEVRALVQAGKIDDAQAKLAECQRQHAQGAGSLESSLAALRGDKFGEEQKKLDEIMNELADVARDQEDLAAEANRLFDAYARKADDLARDNRREASKKMSALVDRIRKRLAQSDETGLTPFAKEELDIVERRLADVEQMVEDGDLAEALGMARQAKQSVDTVASELEAAINDDPKSRWADATQRALDDVERTTPMFEELIDELASLSPRPEQIMSGDDLRAIDRLRRRQAMNRQRTQRLSERTRQMGDELPGDAAAELGKKLGSATEEMGKADERLKARDPSGAREATRSAADALAKARDRARSAARQAQEGAVSDEPIRIPGADEYRAPERFREELQEAARKKGAPTGAGYEPLIDRYYEDLSR